MLAAVLTRPMLFLSRISFPQKKEDQTPILLVHGLYHNKTAWLLMKHRLNKSGLCNIETWQYNSFMTSYPELVLALVQKISKLYKTNPGQKIILVGHSLGGLLISGAVTDKETVHKISGLITLGTPFQGSILAMLAPGRLGQSLHPKSNIFKGKNKFTTPADMHKVAIVSPIDEMVQPWENLKPVEKNWEIIECGPMGHVAMLYSQEVTMLVINSIKKLSKNCSCQEKRRQIHSFSAREKS